MSNASLAIVVDRKELHNIEMAERGTRSDRWQGIGHGDLVDTIHSQAEAYGITPTKESFEVSHNKQNLFGKINFLQPDGIIMPDGTELSLGFRHSNVGHFALTFVTGANVFVCSNGMITGEFIVKRKHTTGVNLIETIHNGLGRFLEESRQIGEFVHDLRHVPCDDPLACQQIIEAGRRGILPWQDLNVVQALWHEPNFPDFEERNQWSLYNAFTEVIRDQGNAFRKQQQLKAVGEMFGANQMDRWVEIAPTQTGRVTIVSPAPWKDEKKKAEPKISRQECFRKALTTKAQTFGALVAKADDLAVEGGRESDLKESHAASSALVPIFEYTGVISVNAKGGIKRLKKGSPTSYAPIEKFSRGMDFVDALTKKNQTPEQITTKANALGVKRGKKDNVKQVGNVMNHFLPALVAESIVIIDENGKIKKA